MTSSYIDKLIKLNACREAIRWARDYPTFQAAWDKCENAEWMLWVAKKNCKSLPRKMDIVLVACQCARGALKRINTGGKKPLEAIERAERWAKSENKIDVLDILALQASIYTGYAGYYAADTDSRDKEIKLMSAIVRNNLTIPEL